jgi:hypothetical protein
MGVLRKVNRAGTKVMATAQWKPRIVVELSLSLWELKAVKAFRDGI